MSWSIYFTEPVEPKGIEPAVVEFMTKSPDQFISPFVKDQVATAIAIAVELAKSPSLGSPALVKFSMSGHANPDHKPTSGYANDTITVSVSQA